MTTWAGLTDSGDVDTDLWSRFGVDISDTTTDETNLRAKLALSVACDYWERQTGRVYGRTTAETKPVQVSMRRLVMNLAAFQSVSEVSRLTEDGTFEVVPSAEYSALKIGAERGTYDSLYHASCWNPGLYQVEAVWGELEVPELVEFAAVRLATYNYQTAINPSGVGVHNQLEGGAYIEVESLPGMVYKALMSDCIAGSVLPRSN